MKDPLSAGRPCRGVAWSEPALGKTLPRARIALASFLAYAISNNVGFAILSGASVEDLSKVSFAIGSLPIRASTYVNSSDGSSERPIREAAFGPGSARPSAPASQICDSRYTFSHGPLLSLQGADAREGAREVPLAGRRFPM
jgi:hypothetical protein